MKSCLCNKRILTAWIAAFLAAALVPSVSAEVILKDVRWNVSQKKSDDKVYVEIDQWIQPAIPRVASKLRAVVTLANRGPRPEEGILLSYAVSAQLLRIGGGQNEGVWAVPFWRDERRVPLLKANQMKDIAIDNIALDLYLKKMFHAGFWPSALRIQVMAEPRQGEGLEQRVKERILPVFDKTSAEGKKP